MISEFLDSDYFPNKSSSKNRSKFLSDFAARDILVD